MNVRLKGATMISRERLEELSLRCDNAERAKATEIGTAVYQDGLVSVHYEFLRQLLAAAEDAERMREIAERAVVALHIQNHAGINAQLFPECRKFLCGDWHALTDPAGGGK